MGYICIMILHRPCRYDHIQCYSGRNLEEITAQNGLSCFLPVKITGINFCTVWNNLFYVCYTSWNKIEFSAARYAGIIELRCGLIC